MTFDGSLRHKHLEPGLGGGGGSFSHLLCYNFGAWIELVNSFPASSDYYCGLLITFDEEGGGSMVECLTGDQGVAGVRSSLEALCCVLEQDTLSSAQYWSRKTCPDITEKLFTVM